MLRSFVHSGPHTALLSLVLLRCSSDLSVLTASHFLTDYVGFIALSIAREAAAKPVPNHQKSRQSLLAQMDKGIDTANFNSE